MATLRLLVVCTAFLVCAVASNKKTVPTPSQTVSSTIPPAPMPTSSPTPPPPSTPTYRFTTKNKNCTIMLDANMNINFTYTSTDGKNKSVLEVLDHNAKVNVTLSECILVKEKNIRSALLALTWKGESGEGRLLKFNFTGNLKKGSQNWAFSNLTLDFNSSDFKNVSHSAGKNQSFWMPGLFDDGSPTVEYQRSYKCNVNTSYQFVTNMSHTEFYPKLSISQLRVQAFEFKGNNTVFGNPRECVAGGQTNGSTVVPIAVGVALAVLVIVVIIAFVISKLVNRRKSSYEAL